MEPVNQARGCAYIFGVLKGQQSDPFCRSCSAFANTLAAVTDRMAKFEGRDDLPADITGLLEAVSAGMNGIQRPESPAGQKKAGNCRLPQGVCFVKASLALLEKI